MNALGMNISPFFAWLLRATLQGSFLICLILLIKLALRHRLPARWHYVLWLVLLVRLSLPWAPQSRLSVYNLFERRLWTRPARTVRQDIPLAAQKAGRQGEPRTSALDSQQTGAEDNSREPAGAGEPQSSGPARAEPAPIESRRAQWRLPGPRVILPVVWLIGAVVLAGYVLARNIGLWLAVKRERPVTEQQILDVLEDVKMQMGVQTIVGLVVTDRIKSPALFGFVRPRILLPEGLLEALSLDELQYVFLHELAHLKRRDIYLGWVVSLLQILHWFNPLIWLAFRRMRGDQEMACDALALSRMTPEEPPAYGRTIVNLLERFSQPQYVPSIAGILEERSNIERRMTMIAKFKSNSYGWSPLAVSLIVVLVCISLPDAPHTKASTVSSARQPTLRRIEVGGHGPRSPHSSPSLDGKYMVSLARTGNLVVKELATGKQWNLTEGGGVSGVGVAPLISPDNTIVVYSWFVFETQKWELRVAALNGSQERLLVPAEKIPGWLYADAWSPDGQFLFGRHSKSDPDNNARLVKVSVDDGSVQYIEAVDANGLSRVDVSSDGRFLAYHRRNKATSKSDIYTFDLLENRETVVVTHPADDKLLGWTPDGQHIFFTSDRMGTSDGWLVAVRQGEPKGLPKMIKPGMGDVLPISFTKDGSLYYTVQYEAWNVYTVELDLEEGKALSEPTAVRDVGEDMSPDWSPDSRYLAYCSNPYPSKRQVIRIRTLATGKEREIIPDLPHFDWLRWCPDNRHLLVPYTGSDGLSHVAQVDVQTGEHINLVDVPATSDGPIRQAEMSSDGRRLAYRTQDGANGNRIALKDMDTGQEEVLVDVEPLGGWVVTGRNGWTLLPDGRRIAVSMSTARSSTRGLRVVSSESGEAKTILPDKVGHLTLANNGRDLLFVRDKNELWRVAIDGSEPQKVWQWEQMILEPRMHPDGRRLAFVSGSETSEMWLMENFLPKAVARE